MTGAEDGIFDKERAEIVANITNLQPTDKKKSGVTGDNWQATFCRLPVYVAAVSPRTTPAGKPLISQTNGRHVDADCVQPSDFRFQPDKDSVAVLGSLTSG